MQLPQFMHVIVEIFAIDKRRKEEDKSKSASIELGAMFEMDSFESESNFSSNSSDEDFIYPQKKKRG